MIYTVDSYELFQFTETLFGTTASTESHSTLPVSLRVSFCKWITEGHSYTHQNVTLLFINLK